MSDSTANVGSQNASDPAENHLTPGGNPSNDNPTEQVTSDTTQDPKQSQGADPSQEAVTETKVATPGGTEVTETQSEGASE